MLRHKSLARIKDNPDLFGLANLCDEVFCWKELGGVFYINYLI